MQLTGLFTCVLLVSAGVNAKENATDSERSSRQAILLEDPYDLIGPSYWPAKSLSYYRYYPWLPVSYLPNEVAEESLASFKSNYGGKNAVEAAEGRLGGLTASILNYGLFGNRFPNNNLNSNKFRLFPGWNRRFPLMINPNAVGYSWKTFESCISADGDAGICTPSPICGVFNGRTSGSCPFGGVCCVNTVTKCGSIVSLNNTYWQSPSINVGATSTCSLTVKLDSRLHEQKQPICQVRLDLLSFSIAQPNLESVCAYDSFQVGGGLNSVPVICGDNGGQHMYITIPNSDLSPTDLQLTFAFGAGATTARSWNIKVAMLPCGVDYLAPPDCLQYFTAGSGTVSSFNWKDVPLAVRQLANQDYQICFRSELANGAVNTALCFAQCNTNNPNAAFRLTGNLVISQLAGGCSNDFLLIANGYDPAPLIPVIPGVPAAYNDRFCGGVLNAGAGLITPGTVCTNVKPFRLYYRTNGDETITVPADGVGGVLPLPGNNMGFCLTYLLRSS